MSQTHLEVFPSEYHMLKFFGQYLPKLDVDASARLAPYLYSYDNELVMGKNLHEFLQQIEEMTALGINTLASVKKGAAFLVFFDEVPKTPEKFLANIGEIKTSRANVLAKETPDSDAVSPALPLVQTTIVEDFGDVNQKEEEVEEKSSSLDEEEKLRIIQEAESLRDDSKKAASKTALESFAISHGVSLSRAKTFDAMLEDLKSAL